MMKVAAVTQVGPDANDVEGHANYKAHQTVERALDRHTIYHDLELHSLDTQAGMDTLEDAYERTLESRGEQLETIQEILQEEGVDGARSDEDVQLAAERLANPSEGVNQLFDATRFRNGEPIVSRYHLDELTERDRSNLYIVVFEVERT